MAGGVPAGAANGVAPAAATTRAVSWSAACTQAESPSTHEAVTTTPSIGSRPAGSRPSSQASKIARAIGAAVLAPHGRLLQFTYAMRGPSAWQTAGLVGQARERVLANLPPARIDVLGHEAR